MAKLVTPFAAELEGQRVEGAIAPIDLRLAEKEMRKTDGAVDHESVSFTWMAAYFALRRSGVDVGASFEDFLGRLTDFEAVEEEEAGNPTSASS